MTSALLPPELIFRALDANGAPLAGGWLTFYAAGTSTPQAAYSDATGATPLANPLQLDANGQAAFWLKSGLSYKINLTDAWSVQQAGWPKDGIIADPSMAVIAELAGTAAGQGDALIAVKRSLTGAVATTLHAWIEGQTANVMDFGAVGDGVTDDTAAFTAMFATGRPWFVPWTASGYLISGALVIKSSGRCEGVLMAKAGFAGTFVTVCNPAYGVKIRVEGMVTYSTDVRPSPYGAAKTVGILVGPTAPYSGVQATGGVILDNCKAQRFSVGLQVATFNVTVLGGSYVQNDHNILGYSYDTSYNQINDVSLLDVQADSAMSSVGQAYGLRVGTQGNGVYTGDATQGVNWTIRGCNFDGAPIFIDNLFGLTYEGDYHEQSVGYTYYGGAIVLGSAGPGYLQNVQIGSCWFTNFDYAIVLAGQVTNLEVRPNSYASIKYSAIQVNVAEAQSLKYWNGVALGNTNWSVGHAPEVQTNFSSGDTIANAAFTNISIFGDGLVAGAQLVPSVAATTNWYPNGRTSDGKVNVTSALGRYRSDTASQQGIAVTQSGHSISFGTPAQAALFNGGDRVTGAGSSSWIKSVDYRNGTAVVDGNGSGATTISHEPVVFRTRQDYGSAIPTTGTWINGDVVMASAPTSGGTIGWVCTTTGTFGTLTGVTGSITTGTNQLTVSSAANITRGMYLTVAGVTGTFQVLAISGTVLTLSGNADATVAGAAVAYKAPVFKAWGAIA